jgi:hypothetical protein
MSGLSDDVIIVFFDNSWIEEADVANARDAVEIACLEAIARDAAALTLSPLLPDDPPENVGVGTGSS